MRILVAFGLLTACSQANVGDNSPVDASSGATDANFVEKDASFADQDASVADADAGSDAIDASLADTGAALDVQDAGSDANDASLDANDAISDVQDAIADVEDALSDSSDVVLPDVATPDVAVVAGKAGCADGTREGFADPVHFPTLAACGGAWDQPGIFNMPAKCANQAGNDGVNAAGTGCTVTDLCAVGWHVCYGKDDVVYRNPNGCAGVMTGATPPVFFTTQMSSTGSFNCASGATATNDLFGCGNLGCDFTGNATCKALCSPLTLSSHDLCKGLRNDLGCGDWCNHLGKYPGAPNSWDCGTDSTAEALNVVKTHPEQQGGVLCCLD